MFILHCVITAVSFLGACWAFGCTLDEWGRAPKVTRPVVLGFIISAACIATMVWEYFTLEKFETYTCTSADCTYEIKAKEAVTSCPTCGDDLVHIPTACTDCGEPFPTKFPNFCPNCGIPTIEVKEDEGWIVATENIS